MIVLYLSGHVCPKELGVHPLLGLMAQPGSYGPKTISQWPLWAADCGGYGGKFDPAVWLPWLDRCADWNPLFVVVPDRFDPDDIAGNFAATQAMWEKWGPVVIERGLNAAWVAQNGATPDDIPTEAAAVFIGGDTKWKLSERAWAIVSAAKARSKWVHIGRVNGAGAISMADSADGNLLANGCDANRHRLLAFFEAAEQPHLALFGGAA